MASNKLITATTYAILASVASVSFILPDSLVVEHAHAWTPPATIRVNGIVRDFQVGNAIFNLAPSGGNGHYAGNIAQQLSAANRPVYAGGGYKVATQWKDLNNNPIAPHLYATPGNGREIRLVSAPVIAGTATVDTFNSVVGPYGGGNVGPAPTYVTGATMPVLAAPTGMGAMGADVLYDGAGTSTLAANRHCSKFLLRNYHVLRINGNRTIWAKDEFKIENFAKLEILPNSSLKVYFNKDFYIQDNVDVNLNTFNPQALQFFNLGTIQMVFQNTSRIYCRVESPNAGILFKNGSQFYGSVTAKSLNIDNAAGLHIDNGGQLGLCNVPVNDVIGAKGANSSGGIPSAAAFDMWFKDVMDENLSTIYPITLTNNGSGVYQFQSNAFYPIDHRLYGNQGQSHNFYFTYTIVTNFTYDACTGQFFEFDGADDAWVFINNKLAIDLGGVVPGTRQYVDMDRLKLVDGQEYTLHLFFAQRNTSMSRFNVRTNIPLEGEDLVYTMSGGVD